jgi:hypothetical protein
MCSYTLFLIYAIPHLREHAELVLVIANEVEEGRIFHVLHIAFEGGETRDDLVHPV